MAHLRIQFFGGFELHEQAGATVRLTSRNAAALLAVLAVGRGRMIGRTKLASLLWDSSDFEHASGSLRQTLFMLRRILGREALREQTDALRLDDATVQTDIWEFADLVERGTPESLARALELYKGDFLEGHRCERSVSLEEWLGNERQRLRDAALHAAGQTLDAALRRCAHDEVQRTALKMLTIDPAEEVAHRALMQVHASERRYSQAMRQFERCRRILQTELNVEPDALTHQLHAEIVQSRTARLSGSVPIHPVAPEMATGFRKYA
jgi:DNA-binding transcriptional activator of the SARP family